MNSFLACILIVASILTPVKYTDKTNYKQELDIPLLIRNILTEYDKIEETSELEYKISIEYPEDMSNIKYGEFVRDELSTYLWGTTAITPSIKVSINRGGMTFKIGKYISKDNDYLKKMNALVEEAKTKSTDAEKLKVLFNYLTENDYVYSKQFSDTNVSIKTGELIDSPHVKPDSVFLNKTGICMGYSNIVADFCDRVGIKNIKTIGFTSNGEHIWNMVKIKYNGKEDWYVYDATFFIGGFDMIYSLDNYISKFSVKTDKDIIEKLIDIKYESSVEIIPETPIPQSENPVTETLISKTLKNFVFGTLKLALNF